MKRYGVIFFLLWIGCCWFSVDSNAEEYDRMGGWKSVSAEGKLYFYTRTIQGVWWFINPAGNAFISKGVNRISYSGEYAPQLGYSPYHRNVQDEFSLPSQWAEDVIRRLREWNFNTVGAWSTPALYPQGMPYSIPLDISKKTGGDLSKGMFPDVFDPAFARTVRREVNQICKPRRDDYFLLGYFLDTGFDVTEDWQNQLTLLVDFTRLPAKSAGKERADAFIKERYTNMIELNEAWGCRLESFQQIPIARFSHRTPQRIQDEIDFFTLAAETYFRICHDTVKSVDPHHLIFSPRFSGHIPEPILGILKEYTDVVAYNHYGRTPPRSELYRIYQHTQKPVLLSEFSFRALDAGSPNQFGRGRPLATQQERARQYAEYVSDLMRIPFVIGYHWYQYTDQPNEGNLNQQSNNYGLVDIHNRAWVSLIQTVMETNAKMERIHAGLR